MLQASLCHGGPICCDRDASIQQYDQINNINKITAFWMQTLQGLNRNWSIMCRALVMFVKKNNLLLSSHVTGYMH